MEPRPVADEVSTYGNLRTVLEIKELCFWRGLNMIRYGGRYSACSWNVVEGANIEDLKNMDKHFNTAGGEWGQRTSYWIDPTRRSTRSAMVTMDNLLSTVRRYIYDQENEWNHSLDPHHEEGGTSPLRT